MYTEQELRYLIINNPDAQIRILKKPYPRAPYKINLSENKIMIDFGWDAIKPEYNPFDGQTHRVDRLIFLLSDYGEEWIFTEPEKLRTQRYEKQPGPAQKRLNRYFELVRRQSGLSAEEHREMIHLEEALTDDIVLLDELLKKC